MNIDNTPNSISIAIIAIITVGAYILTPRVISLIPSKGVFRVVRHLITEVRHDIQSIILISGVYNMLTLVVGIYEPFIICWKIAMSVYVLLIILSSVIMLSDMLSQYVLQISDDNDRINYTNAIPLLLSIVKIALYLFWVVFVLAIFGINVAPFFQGAALMSFVVGLAGRSTLESMFGTLLIFTDRVYRVGDTVRYDDHQGEVVRITIFRTFIRTSDGIVAVTNSHIDTILVLYKV